MRAPRLFLTMEVGAYRYALSLVALLPSRLAYGIGRIAGDLQYQVEASERKMILDCLGLAFGEKVSPEGRIRVAHDFFRLRACQDLDRLRLAGNGQGVARLVNIRGLEHLEHATAQGKGTVIGSVHFGSWKAAIGLLGIRGFPVTLITYRARQRRLSLWQMFLRPNKLIKVLLNNILRLHTQQPEIFVNRDRRIMVAVEAARVLEKNGRIFTMIDALKYLSRHPKVVPIPFLNGQAYLPTGAVSIAKSTGAPLLICLIHRSKDWRHQVMEISAPIPLEGDADEINRRIVRMIEDAIRSEPAHWRFWTYRTMTSIGLLSKEEAKRLQRQ